MNNTIGTTLSPAFVSQSYQAGLLERILKKRQDVEQSRIDLFWCSVNFIFTLVLGFEMSCGYFLSSLSYSNPAVWPSASAVLVVCTFGFVICCMRYVKYCLLSATVELTVSQQKLFGVLNSEPGFRIFQSVQVDSKTCSKMADGPSYSPTIYTGRHSPLRSTHWLDQSTSKCSPGGAGLFSSQSSLGYRQDSMHSTPPSYRSSGSPHKCSSPGFFLGGSGGRSSPSAGTRLDVSSGSLTTSFNCASMPYNQSSSPAVLTSNALATTLQHDAWAEMTGLKSKSRQKLSPTLSPLRTENCIQDLTSLDEYLREQQERESKPVTGETGVSSSPVGLSSFWNYGRTTTDMLPILRQYQYQLAPRNMQMTTGADDSSSSRTDSPSCEHVWTKLGVVTDQLDRWVENLRKWIGKTILSQLVREIDEINNLLIRHGSDDVQIGEASFSSLKQLSAVKSQHIPQLLALIPYIDMVPNQEYLIQRIRDLANGGCISAFKWNGGSEFKGRRWDETLPTDAAILIHLLCSYLDARLPAHPKYPDGKTFTSQHFIKTPDKPNLTDRKDHLCIYQTQMNPPHFKVVIEDTVWNVKEGRHNLFHAILLFLYHVKTKEHGMLRRINLGMSGINIAWVFEQ